MIKVGDKVNWRGCFGTAEAKQAVVDGIEINCVNKEGDVVDEVPWSEVTDRSVIINLIAEGSKTSNWAYGDQVSQIKKTEEEQFIKDTNTCIDNAVEAMKKNIARAVKSGCFDPADRSEGRMFLPKALAASLLTEEALQLTPHGTIQAKKFRKEVENITCFI